MSYNEDKPTQERMDQIVSELDDAIKGGLNVLIPWMKKYGNDADYIGIDFKGDIVLEKLTAAGHKPGQYTGADFVKGDKEVLGLWIIGQAMDCLKGDNMFGQMPPHPGIIDFTDEYMTMPDPAGWAQQELNNAIAILNETPSSTKRTAPRRQSGPQR